MVYILIIKDQLQQWVLKNYYSARKDDFVRKIVSLLDKAVLEQDSHSIQQVLKQIEISPIKDQWQEWLLENYITRLDDLIVEQRSFQISHLLDTIGFIAPDLQQELTVALDCLCAKQDSAFLDYLDRMGNFEFSDVTIAEPIDDEAGLIKERQATVHRIFKEWVETRQPVAERPLKRPRLTK